MAAANTPPRPQRSRGFAERFTAKVGPLPVWAWAALLLVGGYLVYRLTAGKSSSASSTTTTADTSATDNSSAAPANADTSGTPGPDASGGGSSVAGPDYGQLNDQLLSQLAGFGSSIDALTQAVQSSPAFWPGGGDAGWGAIGSGGSPYPDISNPPPPGGITPAPPAPAPSAKKSAKSPSPTRYYTFAPGKAPAGRKGDQAPAHVAGKTLHFAKGKGYYYA